MAGQRTVALGKELEMEMAMGKAPLDTGQLYFSVSPCDQHLSGRGIFAKYLD
jgi:hypothetical protein